MYFLCDTQKHLSLNISMNGGGNNKDDYYYFEH
jgi:hypothetical protein